MFFYFPNLGESKLTISDIQVLLLRRRKNTRHFGVPVHSGHKGRYPIVILQASFNAVFGVHTSVPDWKVGAQANLACTWDIFKENSLALVL